MGQPSWSFPPLSGNDTHKSQGQSLLSTHHTQLLLSLCVSLGQTPGDRSRLSPTNAWSWVTGYNLQTETGPPSGSSGPRPRASFPGALTDLESYFRLHRLPFPGVKIDLRLMLVCSQGSCVEKTDLFSSVWLPERSPRFLEASRSQHRRSR